ncbi:hypothetical protein CRE_03995 [Caenorhabditis remanei]|uniref:FACT complex subunit SSRP1 n=1 Tax=Caenorhabditis remanei TaxID=31234 RepID=E3LY91_CAERE|nr:hypothetical protein CRE_03995 [Caenorhabditis remanei]
MTDLEFSNVFLENMGVLIPGTLKFDGTSAVFKSDKKIVKVQVSDIKGIRWQKLGNKPGIRFALQDGSSQRMGGFKDSDFEKVNSFTDSNWNVRIVQSDLFIKGWNYGHAEVKGKNILFSSEKQPLFEIPCTNVSQCVANKNEAILEFHQNENIPVSLMEMRLYMPVDPEMEDETDKVEEFKKAVLAYAGLEAETEQPITLLTDILCTTPRGRYDIKVYPTSIALHGKTYDYKIPVKSINRLFLVPHKDGRHVYFVLSLNPPIRQGQTRYSYLVFEFVKEDDQEMEITLTDELEEKYGNNLKRDLDGPLYENVSILFKVVCNLKVTVPGRFIGNSGTPAIQCNHKQNPGLLYPMEKGFLFIHKPVMYIRFEEISSCHFARSDAGTVTRTFDFEVDLKNGSSLMFNTMEKEENAKLFDYLNKKDIKIRNSTRIDNKKNDVDSSDEEHDPYKATVTAEGRGKDNSDDDESTDEDYDLDKDLKKQKVDRDSSEGSGSEPDDEYDSGSEEDASGTGESEPDEENSGNKKKKSEKTKKSREPMKPKLGKNGKEKKEKKVKDPLEPKRATTAYFLWFQANRLSFKEDGDTVADVAKKGGAKWKEMGSDDKKEWEEKAAKDKARYEAEMKEYKKNGGGSSSASTSAKPAKKAPTSSPTKYKSKEHISDSDDSDSDEEPKKAKKKPSREATPSDDSDENDIASDNSDDDSD